MLLSRHRLLNSQLSTQNYLMSFDTCDASQSIKRDAVVKRRDTMGSGLSRDCSRNAMDACVILISLPTALNMVDDLAPSIRKNFKSNLSVCLAFASFMRPLRLVTDRSTLPPASHNYPYFAESLKSISPVVESLAVSMTNKNRKAAVIDVMFPLKPGAEFEKKNDQRTLPKKIAAARKCRREAKADTAAAALAEEKRNAPSPWKRKSSSKGKDKGKKNNESEDGQDAGTAADGGKGTSQALADDSWDGIVNSDAGIDDSAQNKAHADARGHGVVADASVSEAKDAVQVDSDATGNVVGADILQRRKWTPWKWTLICCTANLHQKANRPPRPSLTMIGFLPY